MKPVILVLVCVVLVGCPPKPPPQKLSLDPAESCLPAKAACIVRVDGVSLIRASTFWLLDVRGHSGFDAAAVIRAARQCDGPKGCGSAMSQPQIQALVGDLAQATVEKLPITGAPVAAYRIASQGTVFQLWENLPKLEQLVPQLSPVPLPSRLCLPGQCELPPPIPPRGPEFENPGRDAMNLGPVPVHR